jgi:uncharacterized protein YxjI
MREKLISIGDDFWIEDQDGAKAFKVDGKAIRIQDKWVLEDRDGNPLCQIKERKLRVKDTIEIMDASGRTLATVKKALVNPVRDRFSVKLQDGPDLSIKGSILDHEYEIKDGRDAVARVSKKWFRVRDSYGVEIAPDRQDALMLAITVALDSM